VPQHLGQYLVVRPSGGRLDAVVDQCPETTALPVGTDSGMDRESYVTMPRPIPALVGTAMRPGRFLGARRSAKMPLRMPA
jgi:hypothetical protein